MRGIVISPEYELTSNQGIKIVNSTIPSYKLREYLLYWDKIDYPLNRLVHIEGGKEINELKNLKVLQRTLYEPEVKSVISNIGEFYANSQLDTFQRNNNLEPGAWSLAQPNENLALPKNATLITRNLEIELINSIPTFTNNLSFEDILEFKMKRQSELQEFRYGLDTLYSEIVNSGDGEREKLKQIEYLKTNIANLSRVMKEEEKYLNFGTLKVELNWTDLMKNTGAGVLGSLSGLYPLEIGAAYGVLSTVSIKSEKSIKPKNLGDSSRDFAYLYYAKEFNEKIYYKKKRNKKKRNKKR